MVISGNVAKQIGRQLEQTRARLPVVKYTGVGAYVDRLPSSGIRIELIFRDKR